MLFIFIPILIFILLFLNFLLAPSNPDSEKLSIYECGFTSVYGQTRQIFHINFYIFALLFLVFDLEIVLLLPISVCLIQVGFYGFTVAIIFLMILTIGFIFEISSGTLKLNKKKQSFLNSTLSPSLKEDKKNSISKNFFKIKTTIFMNKINSFKLKKFLVKLMNSVINPSFKNYISVLLSLFAVFKLIKNTCALDWGSIFDSISGLILYLSYDILITFFDDWKPNVYQYDKDFIEYKKVEGEVEEEDKYTKNVSYSENSEKSLENNNSQKNNTPEDLSQSSSVNSDSTPSMTFGDSSSQVSNSSDNVVSSSSTEDGTGNSLNTSDTVEGRRAAYGDDETFYIDEEFQKSTEEGKTPSESAEHFKNAIKHINDEDVNLEEHAYNNFKELSSEAKKKLEEDPNLRTRVLKWKT